MGKNLENCLVSREEFVSNLTDLVEDKFAKTFISKADLLNLWNTSCIGIRVEGQLAGALAYTVSKKGMVNLQLLHVFHKYRKTGIGKNLCTQFLEKACLLGTYFRVSSEKTAVDFYRKIGIKFLGVQKSGCLLSVAKLSSRGFSECQYDLSLEEVRKAVFKKGKGGCVVVLDYQDLRSEQCSTSGET